MAGGKPGRDTDNPSPKRKARAGLIVVAILLAMVVVIFVGLNVEHAQEVEESPSAATGQSGG
jgi:hypothetical protein